MRPRVGEVVTVHYDHTTPESIVLDGYEGGCAQGLFIGVWALFAVIGAILIAGALQV